MTTAICNHSWRATGRWCYGKALQTFLDSLPMAREKLLDQQNQPVAVTC